MTTEQTTVTHASQEQPFTLAYVVDATNISCLVRLIGEPAARRARYSTKIQAGGVVIRPCHLVGVAERDGELEVVWRAGTVGRVMELSDGKLTLDLGYRVVTIPYQDTRPAAERAMPPAIGERVLLRGRPIEQAAVIDSFHDGELAHPERLRAHIVQASARRSAQQPGD